MLAKFSLYIIVALVAAIGTLGVNKKFFSKKETVDYEKVRSIVSDELTKLPQPEPQQGNTLDLEKVKGKGHHFHIHQDTKIQLTGGEKLLVQKIDSVMNARNIYRCKCK
jgi:hypothetical protein